MDDPSTIVAEADRAAASGDLHSAHQLLLKASEKSNDSTLFLRLAGIQRAIGQPKLALESVHRALASAPRDFTALLMRASLLDHLGLPAGEAWAHALVQQPDGDPPAHLADVIKKGKARADEWVAGREAKFEEVMAPAEQSASEEERKRLERFRSNSTRRTKTFHSSPTQFHFPELTEREFHPRRLFPWIDRLEQHTDAIIAELQAVMASERAELVPYIEYPDHLPLDQWQTLNRNRDWTAIHLLQNGQRIEANARHCPVTLDLVAGCDQPQIGRTSPNAMFSLLAPQTAIPPHVGVSNTRLVCHLPLVVPRGCWFRVGEQRLEWARGKAFVFDDTIEHEAMNPSDELRIVLIFDIWNPELSAVEREGIAALIASDDAGDSGGL
jgi:aspartyl/asparaginyl beta-hydroxylase (cupin superfamily)